MHGCFYSMIIMQLIIVFNDYHNHFSLQHIVTPVHNQEPKKNQNESRDKELSFHIYLMAE